jgi:hypothetical protein
VILKLSACALLFIPLQAQIISLHLFARAGKYGFMDDDGVVRILAQYDKALDFSEGLAPVAILAGTEVYEGGSAGKNCLEKALKWGFIDSRGNAVISLRYSEVRLFSEGRAAARAGAKWGFIDATGQWIIQPKYAEVHDFHDGLACVQFAENKKFGYIDKSGEPAISAQFDQGKDFDDGMAVAYEQDGQSTPIDRTGRVLVKLKGRIELLGEGLAAYAASYDGLFGLIDRTGKNIQPPTYEAISHFSESLAAVKKNGQLGFIDRNGNLVISLSYAHRYAKEFHQGLSSVYINGRWGYIDINGKEVVAPRFSEAGPFSGGLAMACVDTGPSPIGAHERRDSRCGFIDARGSFVITPRFSYGGSFERGWARVRDPVFDSEMRVNRKGKIVDRPRWTDESQFEPYGECHLSEWQAHPAPKHYSVPVTLESIPVGASVYLIPMWDWRTHGNGARLLGDSNALASYLVTQGTTPLKDLPLKAQVYMAVFDLAGKRKIARLAVAETGSRQMTVSF